MLYITKLPQRRECPYSGQSLLPTHSLIQSRDKRCRHDLCGSCQKDCPLHFARKTSKPIVRKFNITAMTDHQQPISLRLLLDNPALAKNTSRKAIERMGSQRDKRFIALSLEFHDSQRAGSKSLIFFAGTPPTSVLSGMSLVTTAPAATTTLLPMVTPGRMVTLPPIHTSLPMRTGLAYAI